MHAHEKSIAPKTFFVKPTRLFLGGSVPIPCPGGTLSQNKKSPLSDSSLDCNGKVERSWLSNSWDSARRPDYPFIGCEPTFSCCQKKARAGDCGRPPTRRVALICVPVTVWSSEKDYQFQRRSDPSRNGKLRTRRAGQEALRRVSYLVIALPSLLT